MGDRADSQAAVLTDSQPGGGVPMSAVLRRGWYRVALNTSGLAAAVLVEEAETGFFAELALESDRPVLLKLPAGDYSVTRLPNRRAPQADVLSDEVKIQRLAGYEVAGFFAGKALETLLAGDFKALARRIGLAFSGRTGFGASASGSGVPAGEGELPAWGPVARRDFALRDNWPDAGYQVRLAGLASGPVFRVRGSGVGTDESLARQVYTRWTTSEAEDADFDLHVGVGARMTEDALLVLAEAAVRQPEAEVIFADEWLAGHPTAKSGYDPFLHLDVRMLGNIVAIKCGYESGLTARDGASVLRLPLPLNEAPASSWRAPSSICPRKPHSPGTRLAAIVPTRDRADLLAVCLEGLLTESRGVDEIVVVDNGSVENETFALFKQVQAKGVKVVRDEGGFNFSRLCNLGARSTSADIFAFINNDIKVIRADWLENLAVWAVQDDIGAVGTRLYYSNDTLQHGGIALGMSGCAGHLFRGLSREDCAKVPSLAYISRRMAVTGACLVVQRHKFEDVGGFDEEAFPVTLNDVDLCLRLRDKGWHALYVPEGEAYHLESVSRGEDMSASKKARRAAEIQAFRARWRHVFEADVWMSPALSSSYDLPRLR